jgi:hypothetical protein
MATLLYDGIVERSQELLIERGHGTSSIDINRKLIRLAALLHDIGHAPFSHASEKLFPTKNGGDDKYTHEDYSAEIVRLLFCDTINNNNHLKHLGITAEKVAGLIEGKAEVGAALFWRDLISGEMDADRMDYLLRDSHHAGVDYGRYDWRRIVNTLVAIPASKDDEHRNIGIHKGGWHAAEGLILARYFMFTQVYFHNTRVAFDHHLGKALAEILPDNRFPPPDKSGIEDYLKWDDGRVLGMLADGEGGDHGRRLLERDHYRFITETPETPSSKDLDKFNTWREALGDLIVFEERADKSWYNYKKFDIPVFDESLASRGLPLSKYSSFVAKMAPIKQTKLYVRKEDRDEAKRRLKDLKE